MADDLRTRLVAKIAELRAAAAMMMEYGIGDTMRDIADELEALLTEESPPSPPKG